LSGLKSTKLTSAPQTEYTDASTVLQSKTHSAKMTTSPSASIRASPVLVNPNEKVTKGVSKRNLPEPGVKSVASASGGVSQQQDLSQTSRIPRRTDRPKSGSSILSIQEDTASRGRSGTMPSSLGTALKLQRNTQSMPNKAASSHEEINAEGLRTIEPSERGWTSRRSERNLLALYSL